MLILFDESSISLENILSLLTRKYIALSGRSLISSLHHIFISYLYRVAAN